MKHELTAKYAQKLVDRMIEQLADYDTGRAKNPPVFNHEEVDLILYYILKLEDRFKIRDAS